MWHSRPPPFMANAILNFHFDYWHTSLMCVLTSHFLFVIIWVICVLIFLFLFVSTNQFIFVIILVNYVYSVKGGGVPIQMKDSDPRLPENNLDITNIHVFL